MRENRAEVIKGIRAEARRPGSATTDQNSFRLVKFVVN